jgi:hypothetical protein
METMPFLPPGQRAPLPKRQVITYYPHPRASLNLVLHAVGPHQKEAFLPARLTEETDHCWDFKADDISNCMFSAYQTSFNMSIEATLLCSAVEVVPYLPTRCQVTVPSRKTSLSSDAHCSPSTPSALSGVVIDYIN